jgi:hypothetical protein
MVLKLIKIDFFNEDNKIHQEKFKTVNIINYLNYNETSWHRNYNNDRVNGNVNVLVPMPYYRWKILLVDEQDNTFDTPMNFVSFSAQSCTSPTWFYCRVGLKWQF